MGGAGAPRKRMKQGKEALGVKKMNSESQVRRCGQGLRGVRRPGVRASPLRGRRQRYTVPPWGTSIRWGRGVRSDSGYLRPQAVMSRMGDFFFFSRLGYSLGVMWYADPGC